MDEIWNKLSEGRESLMPLDSYPFSERYGWTTDKYGLSWQVMAAGEREVTQRIIPTLMYVGDIAGRAEEAMKFYASVFSNSKVGEIDRYAKVPARTRAIAWLTPSKRPAVTIEHQFGRG